MLIIFVNKGSGNPLHILQMPLNQTRSFEVYTR